MNIIAALGGLKFGKILVYKRALWVRVKMKIINVPTETWLGKYNFKIFINFMNNKIRVFTVHRFFYFFPFHTPVKPKQAFYQNCDPTNYDVVFMSIDNAGGVVCTIFTGKRLQHLL